MNLQDFLRHAESESEPRPEWSPALRALWYAEKGDWDTAHAVCQEGGTPDGAWVHANLHREEGDLSNARHWYRRAERPESDATVEKERRVMITSLLGD